MSARERAEAAKADADRLAAEEARKQALFYARLPPLTQESGDDCNIWYLFVLVPSQSDASLGAVCASQLERGAWAGAVHCARLVSAEWSARVSRIVSRSLL